MVEVEQQEPVWVGLGANVGAPRGALERAVAALSMLPGTSVVGVSRLYLTRPVGPVEQADFLNAAVAMHVPAGATPEEGAMALLVALKGLERDMGRIDRERWGPREIDLDLLLFGQHLIRVPRDDLARSLDPARRGAQWLEVPHPSALRRLFVLAPLADLAPDLEPPGWGETVVTARDRAVVVEGPDAVRPVGEWGQGRGRWLEPR